MKKPITPNSKIRAALRQLWLRSRERAAALKAQKYTCIKCDAKQSRAAGREVYVEVHHDRGVGNWEEIYRVVRRELLVGPDALIVMCKSCHAETHKKEKENGTNQK